MVHVEPSDQIDEGLPGLVRSLAARHGMQAHEIRFYDVLGRTCSTQEKADVLAYLLSLR
mgnify:CR=1 FL=1